MEPKSVRVRIYGTEYPLKVDDEQLTYRAAQHIDHMMSDLHSQIPDQPPVTLAVLSALNVSEELFHAQKSTTDEIRAAEQEIRALTRFMDETLAP